MSIKEILFKHKDEMEKKIDDRLDTIKEQAKSEIDEYITDLEQASKIVLPVNLLEILENGGQIKVSEVKGKSYCKTIAGNEVVSDFHLDFQKKYRIIMIVKDMER